MILLFTNWYLLSGNYSSAKLYSQPDYNIPSVTLNLGDVVIQSVMPALRECLLDVTLELYESMAPFVALVARFQLNLGHLQRSVIFSA
jgi:hypothetical protein